MNNTYFEAKVRFPMTMENGTQKQVTESYIIDAQSFAEAEAHLTKEMTLYGINDFKVTSLRITNYSKIVPDNNEDSTGSWFKVKLNIITLNERTGREEKKPIYWLIQALDIDKARRIANERMGQVMCDYTCEAVSETKITEVYLHSPFTSHE